jgi:hypothetical protein
MFFALVFQGVAVLASALVAWLTWALQFWPFIYGGAVAMANAGLLAWRWNKGLHEYHCDAQRHLKSFHRSLMERFFVVALLLAVGFVYRLVEPGLQPLAMLSGFVVGQLAWVIATAALKTK